MNHLFTDEEDNDHYDDLLPVERKHMLFFAEICLLYTSFAEKNYLAVEIVVLALNVQPLCRP
jgi:hypothetical protein